MNKTHNVLESEVIVGGYSPVPRRRRGNRRAQGGSAIGGEEPRFAGLETPTDRAACEDDELATWLKEQRPPHYE